MSQLVHGGKYVRVCCHDRGSESQYIYIYHSKKKSVVLTLKSVLVAVTKLT